MYVPFLFLLYFFALITQCFLIEKNISTALAHLAEDALPLSSLLNLTLRCSLRTLNSSLLLKIK